MENLYISLFLSILKATIKNPDKAIRLKTQLLSIRDQISTLYPGE